MGLKHVFNNPFGIGQ